MRAEGAVSARRAGHSRSRAACSLLSFGPGATARPSSATTFSLLRVGRLLPPGYKKVSARATGRETQCSRTDPHGYNKTRAYNVKKREGERDDSFYEYTSFFSFFFFSPPPLPRFEGRNTNTKAVVDASDHLLLFFARSVISNALLRVPFTGDLGRFGSIEERLTKNSVVDTNFPSKSSVRLDLTRWRETMGAR